MFTFNEILQVIVATITFPFVVVHYYGHKIWKAIRVR